MRRPLLRSSCLSHIHLFIGYSTDCLDVARDFAHLLACLLGYGDRQQDNRFVWPSVMGTGFAGFSYQPSDNLVAGNFTPLSAKLP